jgi:uncharacterized protein YndB with AHSA1/START domain
MEAMMAPTTKSTAGTAPEPLVISRRFAAPPALVFKAWTNADHMKRWFSPQGFTVPEAEIDCRPGGVFALCMRSPEGQEYWSRGAYIEVAPPDRLVFAGAVSIGGAVKFEVETAVTFEADGEGTRMTVRQTYEIHDADFADAVAGAREGWRTTLDKLEVEVARLAAAERGTVAHATFSLERRYETAPARVFHAFTDRAAKARWFEGGEGYVVLERAMDVRAGGHERLVGRWTGGTVSRFDATYFDVVPNERLVYAYEMHLDDRKISVSLATVELKPDGAGTRLVITEQGTFLGYEDGGSRQRGTSFPLDRLEASLRLPGPGAPQ